MTENNRQQDIKLISDVVEVRISAIAIAATMNNARLYTAAIANDDQAILDILEGLVSETEAAIAEQEANLTASATLVEHMLTVVQLRNDCERRDSLAEIRDTAKANVALLTSGEILLPASKQVDRGAPREPEGARGSGGSSGVGASRLVYGA